MTALVGVTGSAGDRLPRGGCQEGRARRRALVRQLALAALGAAIPAILASPGSLTAQGVPKFEVGASPIRLEGPARPGVYLGGVGRRAVFLGDETGAFEAWAWPVKLFHDFQLAFEIPDYSEPIAGGSIARSVIVRPEMMTVVYSHAAFTVRQHFLVPLDEPGLIVLLDVQTVVPLEIVASFKADLDLMWPAGIGGQYALYDGGNRRFILSESRREYNAYIGSPFATEGSTHPAHAAPDAPSVFRIAVDTARARAELIPIVIAGGIMPRDSLDVIYARLLESARDYYDERVEHARDIRETFASIRTPDPEFDLALEWAKVNLDESLACNPDLGCGLVAGYGRSGRGRRPGFGWFFGGDASINILGILTYGGFDLARAGLDFQRRFRRADGKMPHEVTQSALRTRADWFSEFPYAYYHADTTPYWVVALYHYWLQTADTGFVRTSWPAVYDAYRWGLANDSDGDGIVDNTAAGLGAVEVGGLGADLHQDIYLAAIWVESLRATSELAAALGDTGLAREAAQNFERAWAALEREYYIEDEGLYAFGVLKGGRTNPAVTVWPATAMSFSLLERNRVGKTLDALASHRLLTDWGARMLASDHPLYDPLQYNMGTVWGFVTGFAGWALYNYGRPYAGFAALWANARSTFYDALGRNPELQSGAFRRTLDTTVPHQFFATSMIPTPLFRGLLGLAADAPRNGLTFAPNPPADWDSLSVLRYPVGASQVDIEFRRRLSANVTTAEAPAAELTVRFRRSGGGPPLSVRFAPRLPPGSRVLAARVNGEPAPCEGVADEDGARASVALELDGEATVSIRYRPGIGVVPPRPRPPVGSPAVGLRILRYRYDGEGDRYMLTVEGVGGREYAVELISPLGAPEGAEGAALRETGDGRYRLEFTVAGPPGRYVLHEIRFKNP
jgi:glycogen debranching enzyme